MEYTDLVEAIKNNNTSRVDKQLEKLIPRLVRFLVVHMNASRDDAMDSVQETLLYSLEAIRENRINNPERILAYLLTSCRNNYLKLQSKKKEQNYDHIPNNSFQEPKQVKILLNKEKKALLRWCLKQLKQENKEFIEYWISKPDSEAKKVAEVFGLSLSNTWTRKHRLIKKLNRCIQEKRKD